MIRLDAILTVAIENKGEDSLLGLSQVPMSQSFLLYMSKC